MVRLTPDLIVGAAQYLNPCRDRELDLRGRWGREMYNVSSIQFVCYINLSPFSFPGYKIPLIENLGATLDQFDTVDFSDNEIRKVDNFPLLPRLKNLLLNNNRIW